MDEWDTEDGHSRPYNNIDTHYLGLDDYGTRPLSRKNRQSSSRSRERRPELPRGYFSENDSRAQEHYEWLEDDQNRVKRPSRKRIPSPPRINHPILGEHGGRILMPQGPLPPKIHVESRQTRRRPNSHFKQMPSPPRISRTFDPDLVIVPETPDPAQVRLSLDAKSVLERTGSSSKKNKRPVPSPPPRQHSNSTRDVGQRPFVPETPSPFHSEHDLPTTGAQSAVPMPFRDNHAKDTERSPPTLGSSFFASDNIRPDDSRSESGYGVKNRLSAALSGSTFLPKSWTSSASGVLGVKTYRYVPLNPAEFRLIRILQQTMSTVKCEIEHYSLDDPPEYVAVSYAWGDADHTEKIVLEGATVPVTVSLCGALRALREKKKTVLVWVDALCIDQQNRDERTQQVLLMTSIYAKAKSVVIWLGPEGDDSDLAVNLLEEVAGNANSSRYITSLLSSRSRGLEIPAVVSLFDRDYWKRLWVVQEVFNARDIIVYCGASKLPWDVYRSASLVFRRHKGDLDYYFPASLERDEKQRALQSQFTYSQVLVYHGPSSLPDVGVLMSLKEESLLEVMRACREKLTADARDKLYGILGVLPEHIRSDFPIDYNLSVKEVYTNVADYLLNTTEHLDVICESIHFPVHTSSTNVPSWVPDWSNITTITAIGRSFKFSASKESKAKYRLLDGRRKLEISAVFLDEISEHGIGVGTLCTLADYLMAFLHWRALLLGSTDDRRIDDLEKAFCKTLCLGQTIPGWSEKSWRTGCYHVFASLIRDRLPRMPMDRELRAFVDVDGPILPGGRRQFLQQHFGNRMFGRCFCLTQNGHIGMGSGFMAAGDIVVVPLGCSTPIILRPEGRRGEYCFVGDVYVHNYMEGRALNELETRERELRKYVLH